MEQASLDQWRKLGLTFVHEGFKRRKAVLEFGYGRWDE
jgi:hypothetical protein